ncbi:MAG TPA: hypothetical protein VKB93_11150 [Thermoanaerobaculia bacterium]|nr:hypothetical protein [Thermoanaerobaculia bacterium]
MKLDGPTLRTLRELVVDLLDRDDLSMIVSDVGQDIETFVGEKDDKVKAAHRTLVAANNGGWIDAFITRFQQHRSNDVNLQQFVTSITVVAVAANDPYAFSYPDSRPFVNRLPLRETLPDVVAGRSRILVIKGDPQSGKSHTANLIRALAKNVGFEVVNVNLIRYAQSRDVTPMDIGEELAQVMNLGKPPEHGNELLARWTLSYFAWFEGQVRARETAGESTSTWWILIDGFQSISVPPPVHDFVDELCGRVAATLAHLRVVLISYTRDLATDVEPLLSVDQTGAITPDDLTKFFTQFYREYKPHVPDLDNRALSHATAVASVMNATPAAPIAAMGRELVARCKTILRETP